MWLNCSMFNQNIFAWNAQIFQIHSIAVVWPLNGLFTLNLKLTLFSIYSMDNNIIQFELHVLTFALIKMFVDIYSMARHGSQVMRLFHVVFYSYVPHLINLMLPTQLSQLWLFWEIFLLINQQFPYCHFAEIYSLFILPLHTDGLTHDLICNI